MAKRGPLELLLLLLFSCVLLFILPAPYSEREEIALNVDILVDADDFYKSASVNSIEKALEFSGRELLEKFNIGLVITEYRTWVFPKGAERLDADAAQKSIKRIFKNSNSDIVIAFTSNDIYQDNRAIGGNAYILGETALVKIDNNTSFATLHEIYHLLGAKHFFGVGHSIMRGSPRISAIDKENYSAVEKGRRFLFWRKKFKKLKRLFN
ncbi:MAG: hypothetical protein Q8P07_04960 [bacterium]|nr:hypothetical protein [bacterium]